MEDQITANADENNNNSFIIKEIKEKDSLSKSSLTVDESEFSDNKNWVKMTSSNLDEISEMNQKVQENMKIEELDRVIKKDEKNRNQELSEVAPGAGSTIEIESSPSLTDLKGKFEQDVLEIKKKQSAGAEKPKIASRKGDVAPTQGSSLPVQVVSTIEIESSQSVTDLKAKFEQDVLEIKKKQSAGAEKPKIASRKASALSHNRLIKMDIKGDVSPPQVSSLPVQVPLYEENSSPLMKLRGNKNNTANTDSTSAATNPTNNPPRGRQQHRTSTITSGTISSSQKRRGAAFPTRNSQSPASSGGQKGKNVTKSSVSRPTSGSPTHLHKLRIYDGPPVPTSQNRSRPRSPYVADVFNWPDKNPPPESHYEDVIVTDRQYKLLTNVGTNEKYTKGGREMKEYQNTLYNLVLPPPLPSPRRKSSLSRSRSRGKITRDSGSTNTDIQDNNKSVQKKSVSFEIEDNDLNETQNETNDRKEVEESDQNDQNDGQVSDKNDQKSSQEQEQVAQVPLPNCIEDSNKNEKCDSDLATAAAGGDGDSIGGSSINGEDPDPPREITSLEMLQDFLNNDEELQKKALVMMKEMMNVTEVSFLLMNTFFREIMQNPQAAIEVKKITSFDEFIKSSTEIEALEKAGGIFKDASKRIREYIKEVHRIKLSMPAVTYFNDERENQSQSDVENRQVFASASSTESLIVSGSFNFASGSSTNMWKFVPKLESEKIEINLLNQDGKLIESIFCNERKLQVDYKADSNSKYITALLGSTRMTSEKVPIKTQRIFDMIYKCSSFSSMRFVSTKQRLSKAQSLLKKHEKSVKLVEIPKDQESNWLKKRVPKSRMRKLKAINIYAGIVNQMMIGINKAYLLIIDSLDKISPGHEIFLNCNLPGLRCVFNRDDGTNEVKEIPLHKICQDLLLACEEIDCAHEMGEKSFTSIVKGGIKLKSRYLESISYILDSLKDLKKSHQVDLGALLISLACNLTIIQSSNQTLSNPVGISMIDLGMRCNTYANLRRLSTISEATRVITDEILTISNSMAKRSLKNLTFFQRMKEERKKQTMRRFKLHLFGHPNRNKNATKKKHTGPFYALWDRMVTKNP